MRLPTMARPSLTLFTMMAVGGMLLTACAGDATAPRANPNVASQARTSPFVPNDAQKALIGIGDGTYSLTFDPNTDQQFTLGANHLALPAHSVCKLDGSSGYGAELWNNSCVPETDSVSISVRITDAATDHPRMDFYPAMRFNPETNVSLYIYVPIGTDDFAKSWVMKYCNDAGTCVNEAETDLSLGSFIDRENAVVFRRIKHFSGYIVLNLLDEALGALP